MSQHRQVKAPHVYFSSHGFERRRRNDRITPGRATARRGRAFGSRTLSLVLMALIWGVNFSVVKFGTALVDPLAYNGVRVRARGAVLLVAIALASRGPLPPRRDDRVAARARRARQRRLSVSSSSRASRGRARATPRSSSPRRRRSSRSSAGCAASNASSRRGVIGIAHVDRRHRVRRARHDERRRRAMRRSSAICSCSSVAVLGDLHRAAQAVHRARVRSCSCRRSRCSAARFRWSSARVAGDRCARTGRAFPPIGWAAIALQRHLRARHRVLLLVSRRARHRPDAHRDVLEPAAGGRGARRLGAARRDADVRGRASARRASWAAFSLLTRT